MANNNNYQYIDNIPDNLEITVKANEIVHFEFAAFKDMTNKNIIVHVEENGKFDGAFADFSTGVFKFNLTIYLDGFNASCEWHLASLAGGESEKRFNPCVVHNYPRTSALVSCYGITRDKAKLRFTGDSNVTPNASKSITRQEAKIIVFDETARGNASPILRINYNDVKASHAASVGRLNDDHIFYLESRGLTEEEAKRLITLGYLKPIKKYFSDDELVKTIDEAIDGGLLHA